MYSRLDFERYYKIMDQEQVIRKKYFTKQRLRNVISKVSDKYYNKFAEKLIFFLTTISAEFSESLSSQKQMIIAQTHSTSEIYQFSYQEFYAAAYSFILECNALTMDMSQIVKLEKEMFCYVMASCVEAKMYKNLPIPYGIDESGFAGSFIPTRFNCYVINELTTDELEVVQRCLKIITPSGKQDTVILLYLAKLLAKIFESFEDTDPENMMMDSEIIYPLIVQYFYKEIVMNINEFLF